MRSILGDISGGGHTLAEIAPMPGLEQMFRSAAAGHPLRNQAFEGELSTRPGEHRVWNVSLMPVYGEDRTIQAVTAAWLEITHLKRAEAALVQSEKLAAVGRLASSISHEINNPLEAITNLLYLIAHHQGLPEEIKVFVHMAQSELVPVEGQLVVVENRRRPTKWSKAPSSESRPKTSSSISDISPKASSPSNSFNRPPAK